MTSSGWSSKLVATSTWRSHGTILYMGTSSVWETGQLVWYLEETIYNKIKLQVSFNLLSAWVVIVSCSLPRPKMTNTDLARIINSDEIQRSIRAKRWAVIFYGMVCCLQVQYTSTTSLILWWPSVVSFYSCSIFTQWNSSGRDVVCKAQNLHSL